MTKTTFQLLKLNNTHLLQRRTPKERANSESIQKGTLNALQVARNRLVQRARTFSVSQNYPEIGASSHEDEFYPLSPVCQASSANLFDYVSFDDEPSVLESRAALNKEQLPREQQNHLLACLTCGTTKFESSEYPAITEAYGGDITEPKTEVQKSQISETVSVSIEEAERPVTIEKSEIEQQSANTGYPIVTEAFTCPLNTIYPQRDADLTNLSEYVTFENGSDQLNDKLVSVKTIVTEKTDKWLIQENDHVKSEDKIVPQEQLIDENVQLPSISETQVYSQPPEVIITEVSDLTPQNEIPKYEITEHISFSETGEGSHRRVSQVIAAQKHIIISDEAPEMISAITNMDEPIIIECHDLTRAEEMPSKNLFDTISFESDSDDSGLGADSGSKRKSGLLCIPKSKKTKTSERIEKQRLSRNWSRNI
uniref:Uncharacterized protein n=1 Tax=Panagrolaimus superbus TaxID=310955 RepID=A0A914Y370_9BILA